MPVALLRAGAMVSLRQVRGQSQKVRTDHISYSPAHNLATPPTPGRLKPGKSSWR